ncbi:S8 family serine peptidase [Paracoccus tegillarcae]|uniref:Protease n=1 Tax=Paracoccus tegillarcae TaxID=1529068 RepID=A0A2K9EKS6_9RHOB|nr:S8 family serine peptidase [Paracoccus tegillarcae]AUH34017.1 protease [Paracoccus tegillarcae]
MLKRLCKLWVILGLAIGGATPLDQTGQTLLIGIAFADDDDDGGGNDDDDGGGGGSFSDDDDDDGGPILRRVQPRTRQTPARRAAPVRRVSPIPPPIHRPERVADEIVAPSLDEDDFQALLTQGYSLIETYERQDDSIARRLRIPEDSTLDQAREVVRALDSGDEADFNHFYRSEQAVAPLEAAAPATWSCTEALCLKRQLIGWPQDQARTRSCVGDVTIGLIDTGLNEAHEAFGTAQLDVIRLAPDELPQSQAIHGTAVAALLVGDPAGRSPGLVPGARVIAVDAFHRRQGDERADVFTLIKGLTELAERGADVVNLSLAGPQNSALEEVINQLAGTENIIIVAAVGNAGSQADPLFPAAYDSVIAVTAVDQDLQVYRRAVNGAHVDLAAPGVDVWTAASVSGVRTKTGTSFAVPFVTAAAAMLRGQNPDLTVQQAMAILSDGARDLGEPGHDTVFGNGLISAASVCPG